MTSVVCRNVSIVARTAVWKRQKGVFMYNYREAMAEDIRNYITENINLTEWVENRDGLETVLNDELWTADSVTGNASGSYTFNTLKAQEYVTENSELFAEAVTELGYDLNEIAQRFLDGEWEWFDVTIRCYLLGSVLSDVLDELENEGAFETTETA